MQILTDHCEAATTVSKSKGKRVRIISPHSETTFAVGDFSSIHEPQPPITTSYSSDRAPSPPPPAHTGYQNAGDVLADNPFDKVIAEHDESESSSEDDDDYREYPQGRSRDIEGSGAASSGGDTDEHQERQHRLDQIFPKPSKDDNGGPIIASKILNPFSQRTTSTSVSSKPSSPPTKKSALDVDAFKRLLLTGERGSASPTIPTPQAETGSITDTSSISKQSIGDSQTDLHAETPLTSHEITPSEEDQPDSFSTRSVKSERAPPPVPRPRSNRTKSIDNSNNKRTPSSESISLGLNKPLPPHPSSPSIGSPSAERRFSFAESHSNESLPDSIASATQRTRAAPPPPISRRHSQLRSPAPSIQSHEESIAEEPMPEATQVRPPKPAPAPPPPRRKGEERVPSNPTRAVEPPSPSHSDVTESPAPATVPNVLPPIPPSRTASRSKAATRVMESRPSIKSSIPPPLPPPRNRASSNGSQSDRRGANSSQRKLSSDSKAGRDTINATDAIEPESYDILADLSALQREVDALRGQIK
ncbi:hypothetical protein MMC25_001416 [Agyrium rufum]|nr:hypothetical protein [Agyrium rufum]